MRKIDSIILHCTATPEGRDYAVAEIRQWHKARGWNDIGYHYIIHLDGAVEQGRPIEQVGAHCKGHNSSSIGVAYIGGMSSNMTMPKDTRTDAQKASLLQLVQRLMRLYGVPPTAIYGHHDLEPSKVCPSFDVQAWKRRNAL